MSRVRICFLGTPDFAVTCLKALLEEEHFEVVGVVTQPDRPAGRKLQLTPSPVKSFCHAKGIKVISPETIKNKLILEEIDRWGAEVAVVVAYGQILPKAFTDLFSFGAVNVHASLLPLWRGAAPIQRSLEAGDQESGVTLQKIAPKLDAGDIIAVRRCAIGEDLDAKGLHDILAKLGSDTLRVELMDYVRGNLAPTPQNHELATYAKKIEKNESEIDWKWSARKIHNKVRALSMGPGTFTWFDGKRIKIHRTEMGLLPVEGSQPGTIRIGQHGEVEVVTGDGSLKLLELQPESRNKLLAADLIKNHFFKSGDLLGG